MIIKRNNREAGAGIKEELETEDRLLGEARVSIKATETMDWTSTLGARQCICNGVKRRLPGEAMKMLGWTSTNMVGDGVDDMG